MASVIKSIGVVLLIGPMLIWSVLVLHLLAGVPPMSADAAGVLFIVAVFAAFAFLLGGVLLLLAFTIAGPESESRTGRRWFG